MRRDVSDHRSALKDAAGRRGFVIMSHQGVQESPKFQSIPALSMVMPIYDVQNPAWQPVVPFQSFPPHCPYLATAARRIHPHSSAFCDWGRRGAAGRSMGPAFAAGDASQVSSVAAAAVYLGLEAAEPPWSTGSGQSRPSRRRAYSYRCTCRPASRKGSGQTNDSV